MLYHRLLRGWEQDFALFAVDNPGLKEVWNFWKGNEERQRLLNACYALDTRQAIFHGQNRIKEDDESSSRRFLLPCPDILWTASNAEEWQVQLGKIGYLSQPFSFVQAYPCLKSVVDQPIFTQSVILPALIAKIPTLAETSHPQSTTIQANFPNSPLAHTYLAICNTPVCDLLAVAGDGWIFGQKMTSTSTFREAQLRLGTWVSSSAAVFATQHACKILSLAFSPKIEITTSIFDYWGLYISALICWAYSHHSRGDSESFETLSSSSSNDTSSRVLTFANTMLKLSFSQISLSREFVKSETFGVNGVLDAVQRRLEIDCVGNKGGLISDAITVLGSIQKSDRGLWFPIGKTFSSVKTEVLNNDSTSYFKSVSDEYSVGQALSFESNSTLPQRPNMSNLNYDFKKVFKQDIEDKKEDKSKSRIFSEIKKQGKEDAGDMALSSSLSEFPRLTEEAKCSINTSPPPSKLSASPITESLNISPHSELQCSSPIGQTIYESQSNTSSHHSPGFETDSSFSEDEFESMENSKIRSIGSLGSLDIFQVINDEILCSKQRDHEALIRHILTPKKKAMVERVMAEFWVIFNQEWSENIRKCAGGPSTPSASTKSDSSSSKQKVSNYTGKRSRDHDDHKNPDEDDDRDPKRPKKEKSQLGDQSKSVKKFACPYRKYNPQRYCVQVKDWRLCALTSFDSISRVKGHLYRYHRVFQCTRCKEIFQSQEDLDGHFIAVTSCELRLIEPAEGIIGAVEKQLRSRKKTRPDQTEEERWVQIYTILFPGASIPCAYYEPVQEDSIESPDSQQLSNYEDFSKQALPQIFRAALEKAVNESTQPIEEKLKSQLVDMIRDCQDRVFSMYRSKFPSNTATTPSTSMGSNSGSRPSSSSSNSEGRANLKSQSERLGSDRPSDRLKTFYHEPPVPEPLHQPTEFQLAFNNASTLPVTDRPSESGGMSEPSMYNSSDYLNTEYTCATDISSTSAFGASSLHADWFTDLNKGGLKSDDGGTGAGAGASFDFSSELWEKDLYEFMDGDNF